MVDRTTFIHLHADLQLLEAAYRQRMLPGGDRDAVRAAQRALLLNNAGVSDSAFTATYKCGIANQKRCRPSYKRFKSRSIRSSATANGIDQRLRPLRVVSRNTSSMGVNANPGRAARTFDVLYW